MLHRLAILSAFVASALLGACGGGGGGSSSSPASGGAAPAGTTSLGTVGLVSAGANHSAALAPKTVASVPASGTALLWGDNTWGQVGDGTSVGPKYTATALKSSTLPATTLWKAVAAGGSHTLAIRSDGSLWTWGLNAAGQLGDGTRTAQVSPKQIGVAKDWIAVAAGDAHSVALEATNIMSWGLNSAGQLGLGASLTVPNYTTAAIVPTKVGKAISIVAGNPVLSTLPFTGLGWSAISAGGNHTLVLRADGQIYSWGDNTSGQLGQVIVSYPSVPTPISPLGVSALGAFAISAGRNHSLAIDSLSQLYAWGANASGQLGDGSTALKLAPVQVNADTDWYSVSAGGAHTLAIKLDRSLWAWGSNSDGQLGNGSTSDALVPVQIGTAKNWDVVAAGRFHSMAIDTDGKLWVWGRNAEGQLGLGSAVGARLVPTLVP
jgi:alpha-tubulin suppressor-like RCC1 family protein